MRPLYFPKLASILFVCLAFAILLPARATVQTYPITKIAQIPGSYLPGILSACGHLQRDAHLNCSKFQDASQLMVTIFEISEPPPSSFGVSFKTNKFDKFGRRIFYLYQVNEATGTTRLFPNI
jgi:hypothetical protein